MKRLLLSNLILLTICCLAYSQNQLEDYETQTFREIQDKKFRNPKTSPLLLSDFAKFTGLYYFAFDEKYRVKANLIKTSETKTLLMPTSTGGSRKYLKIGDLSFKLNGQDYSLGAYYFEYPQNNQNTNEILLDPFVPFKDLTNDAETYSAGRYLYFRLPKIGNEVILDFNLSHNPICAYNPNFACTLPPKENFLKVEIKAGEKKYVSPNEKSTH
ncbi:MAG: DUF1684 domain-containing protein [Acidobacteriota bacterium]